MLFFFVSDALQHVLIKNLAHYLLGNFNIIPKGGRSSTTEVPVLTHKERERALEAFIARSSEYTHSIALYVLVRT